MGGKSSKESTQKTVIISETDASKIPDITFSKQLLDFNVSQNGCPLNTPVFDEVDITNTTNRKLKFKFDPVAPASCELSFSPASGTLGKKQSKKIKVRLVIKERVNLSFKITLRIQGGESLFINLKVAGEAGVFGVDPMTLDLAEDCGYQVPKILVDLKKLLIEKNGIMTEGIFRLAGEQTEIKRIKDAMNAKKFDYHTNDINAVASLLKIWYRELPQPILNALPQESIMGFQDANDCLNAFHSLPEPNKTLLLWLLELMKMIVAQSSVNKMTAQNLAIVVAPNLYDISTPNPLEGLFLSQKCAAFLNHILQTTMEGN